jgi:hypothetical protein
LREARTGKVRATAARTLRVLVVEDSENDVMLLLRELRRAGMSPSTRGSTPRKAWKRRGARRRPVENLSR